MVDWLVMNWRKIVGGVLTGTCGALASSHLYVGAACAIAGAVAGHLGDVEAKGHDLTLLREEELKRLLRQAARDKEGKRP